MYKRQICCGSFIGECALEDLTQEEDHATGPGKIIISLEYVRVDEILQVRSKWLLRG